jgi:hypothetical protein
MQIYTSKNNNKKRVEKSERNLVVDRVFVTIKRNNILVTLWQKTSKN